MINEFESLKVGDVIVNKHEDNTHFTQMSKHPVYDTYFLCDSSFTLNKDDSCIVVKIMTEGYIIALAIKQNAYIKIHSFDLRLDFERL